MRQQSQNYTTSALGTVDDGLLGIAVGVYQLRIMAINPLTNIYIAKYSAER